MLHVSKEQAHNPIPKIPDSHHLTSTIETKAIEIENIPRRTSFISRVRKIIFVFPRRSNSAVRQGNTNRLLSALNLSSSHQQRVQASNSSEEDEEEDDIRRPSGLGRPVSIFSLSPSLSYKNNFFRSSSLAGNDNYVHGGGSDYEEKTILSHMPPRACVTNTSGPFRLNLRSRGSKRSREGRSRSNSRIPSPYCIQRVPLRSNTLLLPQSSEQQIAVDSVVISSMPIETIAHIFSFIKPKSSIARISHTCQLFFFASQTVLYTHIDLDDFESESQLEKFFTLLSERQDLTNLTQSFRCTSWPTFFLPTTKQQLSWSSRSAQVQSSLLTHLFFPPDHQDVQHRNTLLNASFMLAFQRMSNLTSLILPAYDHDLLAYHTGFALRELTFLCSTMSKEEGKKLVRWLDGQLNIVRLEFPNLFMIDGDLGYRSSRDGANEDKESIMERPKVTRPATSSGTGLPRQVSGSATIGSGNRGKVISYLVPLNSTSSPSSPYAPSRLEGHRTLAVRTNFRRVLMKLSSRPKSAAPGSPLYTISPESVASVSTTNDYTSPMSLPQMPFPPSPSTAYQQPPISLLSSPTLLPNLSVLQGPPCLIIALSSPTSHFSAICSRRPLHSISLNINTTIYSGLRPASIMTRLIGMARVLNLRFEEAVDKRSIEKVLGAAGSSLGGSREWGDMDRGEKKGWEGKSKRASVDEIKEGFTFGRGEWKGLTELNVELIAGGPGSDEVRCLID